MSIPTSLLWINGSPRASSTQRTYDVINAASQKIIGKAACASSADAIDAITSADSAQSAWEAVPSRDKRGIFLRAAELIKTPKYVERIVEAVRQETSALESWGHSEVMTAACMLLEAATTVMQLQGEIIPSTFAKGGTVIVEKRPLGTVFAISPFNLPVALAARAIAVPLACGNTVVLKSSEVSPRCAGILVEVLYEAGLPNGVLNLLHVAKEDAPQIVAEIIGHDLIRHINFTGSHRVGRIIATEAAKYLKPCVLELGGKAAAVVLNDANVEEAARGIIFGAMFNSGQETILQICMSTERVIVQREVSDDLIIALTVLAKKLHAGTDTFSQLSSLYSSTSAQNIISLLADANSRGAQVLVGDITQQGPILQPHILLGVEPGWPLWEQETFGPVFGIKIVNTEEDAIIMANKTCYSLTSAVWTKDVEKGLRLGRKIRAGQVLINAPTLSSELGVGVHGLGGVTGYGRFDIENFTQRRTLVKIPSGLQLPLVSNL